jgi:hypothetical protein
MRSVVVVEPWSVMFKTLMKPLCRYELFTIVFVFLMCDVTYICSYVTLQLLGSFLISITIYSTHTRSSSIQWRKFGCIICVNSDWSPLYTYYPHTSLISITIKYGGTNYIVYIVYLCKLSPSNKTTWARHIAGRSWFSSFAIRVFTRKIPIVWARQSWRRICATSWLIWPM